MQIGAQPQAELFDERLGGAVHVAAGVRPVGGGGADVDHMADVALDHGRQQRARHVHQPLGVGVDHGFPVIGVGLVRRLQPQRQAGVVHQHVDLAQLGRQCFDRLLNGSAVAHVEPHDVQRLP